ncbi:glycosyltransferase family 4 protein [Enterococcus hulanensis]|uniref:glycosyltransferase family 4 protein n=1 Tax=Enterococcus hulanensis TaxID=2559929 RepID=UPI001A8C8606|nr:glycosyltransferase family 4 protein [Enterococcus hulanensis]MBO0455270.1 glycosyltransferase family 4 protein [Enterococcus hulanensis]
MRRVLFINSSIYLPGEGGYKRTLYLFDLMKRRGYDVSLVTGDFNHYSKEKRNVEKFYREYPEYKNIVILPKKKYRKNISLTRYFSDLIFSNTTIEWVKKHINNYDVVYLNMPNMNTIKKISPICRKLKIPLVVDIRDLHPEAMRVVLKNELIYKFLTFPIKNSADKAYLCADEFVAVSQEYLERGLSVNKHVVNPKVVYIGATLERFDKGVKQYSKDIIKPSNEFWLAYAGTLGSSYDLETVISAVGKLKKEHGVNVRLKILGQGPKENDLKNLIKTLKIENVDFLGFMEYGKMAAYLSKCDATVNCIRKKASQSIINKVGDYFASGIPMLNSCKNQEMQKLIDFYHTGYNYEAENEKDFINKFMKLYENPKYCVESGVNARILAEEKFDRDNSYLDIIETIDNVEFKQR